MDSRSPIARSGLVGTLVQEIAALIGRDQLRPGDRLPTVKALAERFDVAVPTVREAIQRLEAVGVVQVRHGSGIFVRSDHPRPLMAQSGTAIYGGQTIIDLIESRLLIEPYVAELAALSASDEQLTHLGKLLDRAEGLLQGQDHALQKVTMAFHLGIARASGNSVLAQMMEMLVEVYASEQIAMLSLGNSRAADHAEHREILAALLARDGDLARDVMQQHLTRVRDLMLARLAQLAHASKVVWLNSATAGGRSGRAPGVGTVQTDGR